MNLRAVLRRRDRAVSALEFALVMPTLVLILLAIADLGNAMQQSIRLSAAARIGAQVAFSKPQDDAAIRTAVTAALAGWSVSSQADCDANRATGACITSNQTCRCIGGSTFDCSRGDVTCDFTHYARVTVSRPYSPLLIVPQTTLTGNVELRFR